MEYDKDVYRYYSNGSSVYKELGAYWESNISMLDGVNLTNTEMYCIMGFKLIAVGDNKLLDILYGF